MSGQSAMNRQAPEPTSSLGGTVDAVPFIHSILMASAFLFVQTHSSMLIHKAYLRTDLFMPTDSSVRSSIHSSVVFATTHTQHARARRC